MRVSAALAGGWLALLAAPALADAPLQDYLARSAEAARLAKGARDLMADGQSGKACAMAGDAAAAYAGVAQLQARLSATAPADPDVADYLKVVAGQAEDAAGWRKAWCAQVPMETGELAARALASPGAPDQPSDPAGAIARLAVLDAEFDKALKSALFHLKAAYKEKAAGEGAQEAVDAQGALKPGMSPIYDPKLKLWAACMDAGDARKRLLHARAVLDEMRGLGARFGITIAQLAERTSAVAHGLDNADGVCGGK